MTTHWIEVASSVVEAVVAFACGLPVWIEVVVPLAVGAGVTFGCCFFVQLAIRRSTSRMRLPSPDGGLGPGEQGPKTEVAALWDDLVKDPRENESGGWWGKIRECVWPTTGGGWIGHLERFVFFAAFVSGYEWVGASYLALKVATKWQSWTGIVRLADGDDRLEEIPRLGQLRARSYASSWLTTRFLVGTLANLLAGFAGYGVFLGVAKLLDACG